MQLYKNIIRDRLINRRRYRMKKNSYNKYVLYIFKSNKYIKGQIINNGYVVHYASSSGIGNKSQQSIQTGTYLGNLVRNSNIIKNFDNIIFDIRYYRYAGCVKLFIESFLHCK